MATCTHCDRPIEDDDGTWYHPGTMSARCDGPDDEEGIGWGDLIRSAEPDEGFGLQALIDSGMAWKLEGSIGRQCMAAIEDGVCTLGPTGHRDYYGNYVPAIHEVEPGSLGSLEYAEARR